MYDNKSHIFQSTTCIDYQTLLDYHHKKLNPMQQHEVERHLTDCELCTEALEGIAMLDTTDSLNETMQQVSEKYPMQPKSAHLSINRWWYAAASVVLMVAVGWVLSTYQYHAKEELAQQLPATKNPAAHAAKPVEQKTNTAASTREEDNQPFIYQSISSAPSHADMKQKSVVESNKKERIADQGAVALQTPASVSEAAPPTIATDVEEKPVSDQATAKPAIHAASVIKENNPSLKNISGFKTYDYTTEYSLRQSATDANNGINANYETRKTHEKSAAWNHIKSTDVSYSDFLEEALFNYKQKNYSSAIQKFQLILADHPNDVNALFYAALCYAENGQYDKALTLLNHLDASGNETFIQESQWNRALILLKTGEQSKAIALLRKIAAEGGMYATQAQQQLAKEK